MKVCSLGRLHQNDVFGLDSHTVSMSNTSKPGASFIRSVSFEICLLYIASLGTSFVEIFCVISYRESFRQGFDSAFSFAGSHVKPIRTTDIKRSRLPDN